MLVTSIIIIHDFRKDIPELMHTMVFFFGEFVLTFIHVCILRLDFRLISFFFTSLRMFLVFVRGCFLCAAFLCLGVRFGVSLLFQLVKISGL